jgi:hypothetical protein
MRSDAELARSFKNKVERIKRSLADEPVKPKVVSAQALKDAVASMEMLSVDNFKKMMAGTGCENLETVTDIKFTGIQVSTGLTARYEITFQDKTKAIACIDWDHEDHEVDP